MNPARVRRQPAFAATAILAAALACGDPASPAGAPLVHLVPPADSVVYAGEPVALAAEASEGGRALPGESVRWLVDEVVVATGPSVAVRLDAPGQRIVVVEAVGSTGLTARDAVPLTVLANSAPVLYQARICCSSAAFVGDTLLFTAYAVDVEHGVLTGAGVHWSSDRDGPIGEGDSVRILASALSPGSHAVTVRGVDPAGNADSVTLALSVLLPPAEVLWSRIIGDGTIWTFQGDVLAGNDAGNLYIGLQGYRTLWALDAAGRTRWTYDMPNQLWDHSTGLTVSPDGTVYVFDFSGNGAALSSDGALRWAVPVVGPDPHGRYALTAAGELYAAGDRGLSRIDPASGAALWTVPLATYYGGPAVAPNGRVVTQFDREFLVTDRDGNVLFNQIVTGPEGAAYPLLTSSMAWDGTSYLQGSALSAVALDGALRWQIPVGQQRAEPVVAADGRLFTFTAAGNAQSVIALSDSGTMLWEQPVSGWSYIPRLALLADQTLLAMTGPNLTRLDAATGAVLNTIAFPLDIASAPVVNPDGTIVLLTNDHRLIGLRGWAPLDPDAPWPTWRRDNRRTAALTPSP